jgi:uncharacterized Zn finger protein
MRPPPPEDRPGHRASAAPRSKRGSSRRPAGEERRSTGPRRVRTGLKLRGRDDVLTASPLAERWRLLLEDGVPRAELNEGLRYARLGQTISMAVEEGALRASVQGSRAKPYETIIRIGPFSAVQWERVIEAMAGEAVYLVKLLDGELPEGLDTLLAALGLSLLPETAAEIDIACSCKVEGPCRHAAAVGYLFTEQLSNDPLQILTLRGMPAARLLERLRQARTIQARGVAAAHADPMIPQRAEDAPPLEACVEEFWRPRPSPRGQTAPPPPQHVSHALLRRLGPPPLDGRFPLVGLLASIYDSVAQYAVHLRDQAERLEEGREAPRDEAE